MQGGLIVLGSVHTEMTALLEELIVQADARLVEAEGHGLERLVATIYEERSRKRVGDFGLTHVVRGWWDRGDTEIDLVEVNETEKTLRLASCKRSPERLLKDLSSFDGHIARFLAANPKYQSFRIERVAIASEARGQPANPDRAERIHGSVA